ncbi:NERD domain-containing protein/DEAD/DEAH box helicase [Agrococcus sp. 1P02AA]|uniref:nuclease-related domain-containing DEAD/DEAH box helicase n=1 Tax=Agrococcus sp. 1P02AA TaxID=3132259 RepID=UPI0039A58ADA
MLVFGAGQPTGSEKLVANLLRDIDDDGALAFFSTNLRRARVKREAEADFIVLWKGAVIVLEIKGGSVSRDGEGRWWLETRTHGRRAIEDPMKQAQGEMYALRDLLHEIDGIDIRDAATYAVFTPFIDAPPESVGWHPDQWLARGHVDAIRIEQALDALASRVRARLPRGSRILSRVSERLGREFIGIAVYDAERRFVLSEQDRLTQEQVGVLLSMENVKRAIIEGGAGTGKSMALALAARQASDAGDAVLVTFASRSLVEYFHALTAGTAIVVREFARLGDVEDEFDFVLVDEAQDMMNEPDLNLVTSKLRGGLDKGRWLLAMDPNNQAHVEGRFEPEWFEAVREEAARFSLKRNVRNTSSMVDAVQDHLLADIGTPTVALGRQVRWETVTADADVDQRLERVVAALSQDVGASEGRDSMIVISVQGRGERSSRLLEAEKHMVGRVPLVTPRMVKGLEFDHVVVVDVPAAVTSAERAALYVSMTRARVSLTVILDEPAMAWMRGNARLALARKMEELG